MRNQGYIVLLKLFIENAFGKWFGFLWSELKKNWPWSTSPFMMKHQGSCSSQRLHHWKYSHFLFWRFYIFLHFWNYFKRGVIPCEKTNQYKNKGRIKILFGFLKIWYFLVILVLFSLSSQSQTQYNKKKIRKQTKINYQANMKFNMLIHNISKVLWKFV